MSERIQVLLVEDNPNDAELVLRELRRAGLEADWKQVDTEPAYLSSLHPGLDVILSDYAMPQFNGLRALALLKERGWDVPFILVSGTIGEEAAVTAIKEGAADYLLKDRLTRLGVAVRQAIEKCRLRREGSRTEEELRLFRALIDRSNDAVEVIDPESARFLDVNLKSCLDLGYTREELLSMRLFDTDPDRDPASWADFVAKMQQTPFMILERIHRRKDGTLFPVEVNVTRVQLDRDYIVAVVRDITDRKQLEEQLRQAQKMESIGQLAGGVAHDFNNILTVIQMHASLMLCNRDIPPELAESTREIALAAERASGLTRQLLAFGRRQILQSRNLNLNDIVREIAKMLERIVGEDIQVRIDPDPELPPVCADPGMMEQILLNLAVNSRDAMPEGGELRMATCFQMVDKEYAKLHPEAREGRFVRLTVRDSGCGIPDATLEHIFEPFFTTKEVGKGTGLGLATVYGIVKQHNGWIQVESAVGRGTAFHIFLPVVEGEVGGGETRESLRKLRGGKETILVVEDEKTIRMVVCLILERYGYQVLEASTGVEALGIWEKEKDRIDLVLTDIVMPSGITGRELGAQMTADKPSLKVIYSSGYAADTVGGNVPLEEGVNYMQKPYAMDRLIDVVRSRLDRES